jgi:RNA 3'-terminal phosphate cyclase (ATP)
MEPILIDGSQGEGGGQILRTSLSLSMVTGRPFRIERIRAGRERPGLLRQHLACVEAAAAICGANVRGAVLGSMALEFQPGTVRPGDYAFAVGSAGSAGLVFQTVLPALLQASGASKVSVEGGTHNPLAPPAEFLVHSFLTVINRMGPKVELNLERPGFFPAGGGRLAARVEPSGLWRPVELLERGAIIRKWAVALVAKTPLSVAERQRAVIRARLGFGDEAHLVTRRDSIGPGNAVLVAFEAEAVTSVFSALGMRGRGPEDLAHEAADAAELWLAADVPVDEHLADQLMIPMALAGRGAFRTTRPSGHSITNAETIARFLAVSIGFAQESELVWRVVVPGRADA